MSDSTWQEGFGAFYDGLIEDANPYDKDLEPDAHMDWLEGYKEAEAEYENEYWDAVEDEDG